MIKIYLTNDLETAMVNICVPVTLNQVMANVIRMNWETKLDNVIIMKEQWKEDHDQVT